MVDREAVETVAVVIGGAALDPVAVSAVAGAARVVAADGGLDHARAAGLRPDVLVGDLDSVSAVGLAWARANITVEDHDRRQGGDRHGARPPVCGRKPAGAPRARRRRGDRLDHALAALGALGSDALATVPRVEGWWGSDHLLVVRAGPAAGPRGADGHDVLAARPARTVPRRLGHRRTLAVARRRPRPAGRSRRLQRGRRTAVPCRCRRRRPHRHRPGSTTMNRSLLGIAVAGASMVAAGHAARIRRPRPTAPRGVTLVVYDSFPTEGTPLNDALDRFGDETGIDVELLVAGDTGTMVSKAVLTAGNPEGDVMWGVDNTYLSRVVERRGVRAVRSRPASTPSPPSCAPSSRTTRRHRSTSATSASTTTSSGSTSEGIEPPADLAVLDAARVRRPPRRREPGVVVPGTGLPDGHGGRVRRGRLGRLLASARRQRRRGRRRLDRGLLRALQRCRRRAATARRQLRQQPAGRGPLRRSRRSTRRRPP